MSRRAAALATAMSAWLALAGATLPARARPLVAAEAVAATQAPAEARAREEKAPRFVVVETHQRARATAPAAARQVPTISLSVRDADLVEVVRSLARIAGVNVIFDPRVSGRVTAELVDVRWDHALAVILKTQGLAMELDGRILTVATPQRWVPAK
jgi:type II secretory pathway component GspD/PulD (secretin)